MKGDAWKGKQNATEALEIAKKRKDKKAEAAANNLLAKVLLKENVLDTASQQAQEAIKAFKALGFKQGEATALNTLANVRMAENNMSEAIEVASQATDLFKDAQDQQGQVSVLHTTIQVKFREDRLFHALCIAQEMAKLYVELADLRGEGAANLLAAEVHLTQDCYQEAMDSASSAATCFDQVSDWPKKGRSVRAMARAFIGVGQFDDAVEAAEAAVSISARMRDRRGQADGLVILATGYDGQSKYKKSVESLSEATALFRQLKDKQGEASVMGKMAQSQLREMAQDVARLQAMPKSQLEDVVKSCERVVAAFVDLGLTNTEDFGNSLLSLAGMLLISKQYEQAIARGEEAQQLFSAIGALGGEARALIHIAKGLYRQDEKNNVADAQSLTFRAKEIAEESCDDVAIKEVQAFLKVVSAKKKPVTGGQTTAPVDVEYVFGDRPIMSVDSYQGRSTTTGKVATSSSTPKAIQEGDGTTVYDPSLLKIPAKKQVVFTLKYFPMPRGDRSKLVLPENLRAAIAA
jgi:tetratricopeptide (TPR) repeat protein